MVLMTVALWCSQDEMGAREKARWISGVAYVYGMQGTALWRQVNAPVGGRLNCTGQGKKSRERNAARCQLSGTMH